MLDQMEDAIERRQKAVARSVERIRGFEQSQGVTAEALEAIKAELISLAAMTELFSSDAFPAPEEDSEKPYALYLLSEDDDNRFALYLQACRPVFDVPPHNHTTWACIVGLDGEEENRFYERGDPGAVQTGAVQTGAVRTGGRVVGPGDGVAFLPDELHSIHIHGPEPARNFHMYGLGLQRLFEREFWSEKDRTWKVFPPQDDIIDRRAG